jgi:hypothetical protein
MNDDETRDPDPMRLEETERKLFRALTDAIDAVERPRDCVIVFAVALPTSILCGTMPTNPEPTRVYLHVAHMLDHSHGQATYLLDGDGAPVLTTAPPVRGEG